MSHGASLILGHRIEIETLSTWGPVIAYCRHDLGQHNKERFMTARHEFENMLVFVGQRAIRALEAIGRPTAYRR